MKSSNTLQLIIALGIWIVVLQNAGVIPTITTVHAQRRGVMDVNLHSIVGRQLVESDKGMYIGVDSADGKSVVPIHWGEITIAP